MIHPDMERLESESGRMVHAGRIIPVYPQTAELSKSGLSSKNIRNITTFIFEHLTDSLKDFLPKKVCDQYGLPALNEAVSKIHYPENRDDIETARRRLAFDELLKFQYLVFKNKDRKEKIVKKHSYPDMKILPEFIKSLPFELTPSDASTDRP